jgi:hypothetical protein
MNILKSGKRDCTAWWLGVASVACLSEKMSKTVFLAAAAAEIFSSICGLTVLKRLWELCRTKLRGLYS